MAISIDETLIEAYNLRSEAYIERDLPDKAIEDCGKVLALDHSNALALNNRGVAYLRKGDRNKALEDLRSSCNLGLSDACRNIENITGSSPPKSTDHVPVGFQEAFDKGDLDMAIKLITEAIMNYPSDGRLYVDRCAAYANKGALNEALEDCSKAIAINPDNGLAYYNRAYALEQAGKKNEAAVDYEISCNLGNGKGCQDYERISSRKTDE